MKKVPYKLSFEITDIMFHVIRVLLVTWGVELKADSLQCFEGLFFPSKSTAVRGELVLTVCIVDHLDHVTVGAVKRSMASRHILYIYLTNTTTGDISVLCTNGLNWRFFFRSLDGRREHVREGTRTKKFLQVLGGMVDIFLGVPLSNVVTKVANKRRPLTKKSSPK